MGQQKKIRAIASKHILLIVNTFKKCCCPIPYVFLYVLNTRIYLAYILKTLLGLKFFARNTI
jgi:hypothetical protein